LAKALAGGSRLNELGSTSDAHDPQEHEQESRHAQEPGQDVSKCGLHNSLSLFRWSESPLY
jgi:hypothetical protein